MKSVVFYEGSNATMEQIMAVYPRHKAYLSTFVEKKLVLGIGPFSGPKAGSMGIFVSRDAAEEFIKNDPFVLEGLAGNVSIKEWNDDI
jgi:uncharacterized protein